MSENKCCKKTSIGGQALIEGIMMRGPFKTVMAVRESSGNIAVEELAQRSIKDKHKFFALPIIRGAVSLIESMVFGYKALMLSAEKSGMLDEADPKQTKNDKTPADNANSSSAETITAADILADSAKAEAVVGLSAENVAETAANVENTAETAVAVAENTDAIVSDGNSASSDIAMERKNTKKEENSVMTTVVGAISMVLGIALALVLFMYLPSILFDRVNSLVGNSLALYKGLFEGVLKIAVFLIYMLLVSQMKDIKRVFMYHGAEHKTIFCYEHGKELTVENVRTERRFHPRCGTSFIVLMLLVSVLFYSIVVFVLKALDIQIIRWVWVCVKLLLLPVICGVGYELIKLCARRDNLFTRIIAAPGMWVQHITTKEPDDSMIEVAIRAMTEVIPENGEDEIQ